MKHIYLPIALVLILSNIGYSQFDFSRYKNAKLDTLANYLEPILDDTTGITITGNDAAYKVRVVYGDSIRPIDQNIVSFLHYWEKILGSNITITNLFQHEMLVREGDCDYWIPVQEPLIVSFNDEVQRGQPIFIFVSCLGAIKSSLIFTINEFTAEL